MEAVSSFISGSMASEPMYMATPLLWGATVTGMPVASIGASFSRQVIAISKAISFISSLSAFPAVPVFFAGAPNGFSGMSGSRLVLLSRTNVSRSVGFTKRRSEPADVGTYWRKLIGVCVNCEEPFAVCRYVTGMQPSSRMPMVLMALPITCTSDISAVPPYAGIIGSVTKSFIRSSMPLVSPGICTGISDSHTIWKGSCE